MAEETVDQQRLVELMSLLHGSDSVELKQTVSYQDAQIGGESLGFDPIEAEVRQVVFFDTPDLALHRSGVVVRARRFHGGGGDAVVKRRPVNPSDVAPEFRASKNFGIDTDVMPNGFVCSGSMKEAATAKAVHKVLLKRAPIKDLFSKDQRQFYKSHAPEGLKLNDLEVLGPIFVLKLKSVLAGFERKVVAEAWLYPDGRTVFELSTKCLPEVAFQVAAEWKAELVRRGVDLTMAQSTKTKTALEYFSANL